MTATVKVVDASAVAAVIFDEPGSGGVAQAMHGFRLTAPALLEFELANVCMSKSRRFPSERGAILAMYGLRLGLNIEELAVDHDGVVALAAQTGLTAYDASYLWLARRLGVELVTLDAALLRAVT